MCSGFLPLMGDSMNKWKIFILCMAACLLAIPAVSAEEYVINFITEGTLASAEKDYIVSPWTGNSPDSENSIFLYGRPSI